MKNKTNLGRKQYKSNVCKRLRDKRTIHRIFNEIQTLLVVSFAIFLDAA